MAEEKKSSIRFFLENMERSHPVQKRVKCKKCGKDHFIMEEFTAPYGRLLRVINSPEMHTIANAAVANDPTSIRKFATNKIYDRHLMGLISKFQQAKSYTYVFEYWYSNTKRKQGETFMLKFKTQTPVIGLYVNKYFEEDLNANVMIALAATESMMYNIIDKNLMPIKKIKVEGNNLEDLGKDIRTEINDFQYK